MTARRSFYRKIAYLVAMVPLIMILRWVSAPATGSAKGAKGEPGGILARMRDDHDLSEAELGEIDPTSETIKLATLGLRGVAANILWEKANRYKMKKDWTNLSATLRQITKLEPHFISVWRYQAWNLSYNVSAEFDDYRKRYDWVIKGIHFLEKGVGYNDDEPRLVWDMGWFTGQKIGRADEHKQFRRLFQDDDDFHDSLPFDVPGDDPRDNWLVGKEWFARAEALVDDGASLKGMSPVIFFSDRPMSQMNYAETKEEEGDFEDRAEHRWNLGYREWTDGPLTARDQIPFGLREMPASSGERIRLNDRESKAREALKLRAQLDDLAPGVREQIAGDKRARLSTPEREAYDKPPEERTANEHELAARAKWKLNVTHDEVAERLTGAQRSRAEELAEKINKTERLENLIRINREIVNFEYWRRRAKVEQTPQARGARQAIYEGNQAHDNADLNLALAKYQQGFEKWRELLNMDEVLIEDQNFGQEWMEIIQRYRKILGDARQPFPDPFILQEVIDRHRNLVQEEEEP